MSEHNEEKCLDQHPAKMQSPRSDGLSGGVWIEPLSPDSASQKREYSGRPPETFGISIAYDHAMGTRVIKPNARKPAIGGLFANSRRFRKIPHWVAGEAVLIASVSERPQDKIDEVYWGPI
jgi:hypothetical protein